MEGFTTESAFYRSEGTHALSGRRCVSDSRSRFPILVVEDEPVAAALIAKRLRRGGHEVEVVENGRQALELMGKRFFPFVVTDWEMPEVDGIELVREIRAAGSTGYCYIIILTAKTSKSHLVEALEAGADDFVTKSDDHDELLARIDTGMRVLQLERSLVRANREIRALSLTDPLTGCYNRTYLEKYLPKEIERARRYGRPLSLLLCDIDHFKKVNDTYGHRSGDRVLIALVRFIMESVRENADWVARYGGEEFLIVAPETTLQGAVEMAGRIRGNLAGRPIELQSATVSITASIGVSSADQETDRARMCVQDMFNAADEQLYKAKMQGRNRVFGRRL